MNKSIFKTLLGVTLPLAMVTGCAHSNRQTSAAFAPLPAAITPTSNRPEPRIYGNEASQTSGYPAPAGASSQDWALAQRIQSMLTTNPDLASAPVAVVVHGSTVILRGSVPTKSEGQKVQQAVAAVPGVQNVQNDLQVQNAAGNFSWGQSKSY